MKTRASGEAGPACFEALFMGTRGENSEELERLVMEAIRDTAHWRRHVFPEDPCHITEEIKGSAEFQRSTRRLREEFHSLLDYLKRSVPAFSMRYQAHMGWDLLIPGILGYFSGMLHGSNNVAYEGSPATTVLEALACQDICRMLGYSGSGGPQGIRPWGHLTGGATVSNIEALWAVRNLKYLPFAVREALDALEMESTSRGDVDGLAALERARDLRVTCQRAGQPEEAPFFELSDWELLNLPMDVALDLPRRLAAVLDGESRGKTSERFEAALNSRGLNVVGVQALTGSSGGRGARARTTPRILVSGTRHYSFEKAAGLLGLGQESLVNVFVDESARMDMEQLERRLQECLDKRISVLAVVATLGTTEEGAVDPLADILELRTRFRRQGLEFAVHVDAAWGGYHASLVREDFDMDQGAAGPDAAPPSARPANAEPAGPGSGAGDGAGKRPEPVFTGLGLSQFAKRHYQALPGADSIAVDPHKQGHIPFPAGAVCYRNSALRDLVKFSAPYLGEAVPQGIRQVGERTDLFMGVFGVEGSRPGAAAASVFLTHRLVRPSRSGYGALIGMEMFNCKKIFALLEGMNSGQDGYLVVPLAGGQGRQETGSRIDAMDCAELAKEPDLLSAMEEMGPDLNIVTYLFNFRVGQGYNQDPALLACFNQCIYNKVRLNPEKGYAGQKLIVSQTVLLGRHYGPRFINGLLARLRMGLRVDEGNCGDINLVALRSTEADPWLSETRAGSFLPEFRKELGAAVQAALGEVRLIRRLMEELQRERSPMAADPLLALRLASLDQDRMKSRILETFPDGPGLQGAWDDPAAAPWTRLLGGLLREADAVPGRGTLAHAALRHFDEAGECPSA